MRRIWGIAFLAMASACSVWANDDYEFTGGECFEALDCASQPFSTPSCDAGRCVYACDDGRADCSAAVPGCETDVSTDEGNCGACGTDCGTPIGGNDVSCRDMVCVTECVDTVNFRDCDGNAVNGCETSITDARNCGECGNACAAGDLCDVASGSCVSACPMGSSACGDSCVDTTVNVVHCGSCDRACGRDNVAPGGASCVGGECAYDCVDGFDLCPGDDRLLGCATRLNTVEDCGRCGRACEGGSADWSCGEVDGSFSCMRGDCDEGFADCDGDGVSCEVDITTVTDCGGCGRVCGDSNGTPSCDAGACAFDCDTGFLACGDGADGCGTDGTTNADCGACGRSCDEESSVCTGTSCETCAADTRDCDLDAANGCESDSLTDAMNCGACGTVCETGECVGGVCDPVIDLSPGIRHTCLVRASGATFCLGRNDGGQSTGLYDVAPEPQRIMVGGEPFDGVAVTALDGTSCAIDSAGRLWCWGSNSAARAGHSTGGADIAPVEAAAGFEAALAARTFTDLDGVYISACALDDTRQLWCWGATANGRLGEAVAASSRLAKPVTLPGPVESFSVGVDGVAAILDDGTLWVFGDNSDGANIGRLGLSGPADVTTPTQLAIAGDDVQAVSTGRYHVCWIAGDPAEVICVGRRNQITQGGGNDIVLTPTTVDITNPTGLDAGELSTCATTSDSVFCWGRNGDGELGSGAAGPYALDAPVEVVGLPSGTPTFTGHGRYSSCVSYGGQPYCWGLNAWDNLNVFDGDDWVTPAPMVTEDGASLNLTHISMSGAHGSGVDAAGQLWSWGSATGGGTGHPLSDNNGHAAIAREALPDITDVACGLGSTCVISAGQALCAGSNDSGRGGRTAPSTFTDFRVVALAGTEDEIASGVHGMAVRQGGLVYYFGASTFPSPPTDVIDGGSDPFADPPVPVAGLSDATQITMGSGLGCATRSTGGAFCWGLDNFGQRGDGAGDDGQVDFPTDVSAVRVEVGNAHACAIVDHATDFTGRVMCWGTRSNGRLGDGSDTGVVTEPSLYVVREDDAPLDGIVDIATGHDFTCALHGDGTLYCWGYAGRFVLGRPESSTRAILRPGITDATRISAASRSGYTLCVERTTGGSICLGDRSQSFASTASPLTAVASATPFAGLGVSR